MLLDSMKNTCYDQFVIKNLELTQLNYFTEAPQAPESLKVKAKNTDKVTLEWKAPKDIGGSKVTGYQIFMKEDDSDDWKKIGSVGAFDTAYTAKNLKTGKQYKFAVAAENKIGRGELSELESPIILQKKPGNK